MIQRKIAITFFYVLFLAHSIVSTAQVAMGSWRVHLPYNKAIAVAPTPDKVYCATEVSLFSYSKYDNSIERMSKINGLSDIGFSTIKYSKEYGLLIIGYNNGNIDLIRNQRVINISDIKRKQIFGSKRINNITLIDNFAYLACGFGIVVFNLEKLEIADTYLIGYGGASINVNEIISDGNNFWTTTEEGVFVADINSPNLLDFNNWKLVETLPDPTAEYSEIAYWNGKILIVQSNEGHAQDKMYVKTESGWQIFDAQYNNVKMLGVQNNKLIICNEFVDVVDAAGNIERHIYTYNEEYPIPYGHYAVFDEDNTTLWIADNKSGLVKNLGNYNSTVFYPQGPAHKDVVDIDIENNILWAAAGGMYSSKGAFALIDEKWHHVYPGSNELLNNTNGYQSVAINPQNDNNVAIGTLGYGIIELHNNKVTNVFNKYNSSLQNMDDFGENYVRVHSLTFDDDGNLWAANQGVAFPISMRNSAGDWTNFSDFEYSKYLTNNDIISKILPTSWGDKWVFLTNGRGIFIFNENDAGKHTFTTIKGNDGTLMAGKAYTAAEDLNGAVWVGTDKGAMVYYSPKNIFENSNFYASMICVETTDTLCHPLLETETVTAIAVDGANRKWFGTSNNGVYLMSEDGAVQQKHFNTSNSPLLSNTIFDIEINHKTGEVFFATNDGLISYKSEATKGSNFFTDVYVYPNPVRPGYEGLVTITGLVTDVNVKITDLSGHLVFETTAFGGQAVWDGKTLSGRRVHSGIYLVYCTTPQGERTHVTKLIFMK